MFKNRITASMITKNPLKDNVFQKFESFFDNDCYSRKLDWSIIRDDVKYLQYSEVSEYNWNITLNLWQMFSMGFILYNKEVKYDIIAKEIVIDIWDEDSSICIIINFNI